MMKFDRSTQTQLDVLACPLCRSTLHAVANSLRCEQNHSFDRAREGYYNLLAVQHKASRDPGDSREMVAARRRILDAGLYAPIATRNCEIARRLVEAMDRPEGTSVLDAGCGEGYYLDALANALSSNARLAGIDISKWAIRAAAKRNSRAFWAVASNRQLPFAPASVDLILSMFGFPLWDAFAAVQSVGGYVLLVDPGPDHLIEMRSIIYPQVNLTKPHSLEAANAAGYKLIDEQWLRFDVGLTSAAQIADLLGMTPHDYRAPLEGREALARLSQLSVTADVVFRTLLRR
jgi:23S rRNA (guanine745-N1)-methyltransferase